jgi:hypothetical protein
LGGGGGRMKRWRVEDGLREENYDFSDRREAKEIVLIK